MKLWHMYSFVLEGFYCSDVVVLAENLEEAVKMAMKAYDKWINDQFEMCGYNPLVDYLPDEKSYSFEATFAKKQFEVEAISRLRPVEDGFLIFRNE